MEASAWSRGRARRNLVGATDASPQKFVHHRTDQGQVTALTNAFIERWVKSIKVECLSHFIVFGKKHLDFLVSSYLDYYNELRPHQSLDNRPLSGKWSVVDEPLGEDEKIVCHERLGGLLRHYERVAA